MSGADFRHTARMDRPGRHRLRRPCTAPCKPDGGDHWCAPASWNVARRYRRRGFGYSPSKGKPPCAWGPTDIRLEETVRKRSQYCQRGTSRAVQESGGVTVQHPLFRGGEPKVSEEHAIFGKTVSTGSRSGTWPARRMTGERSYSYAVRLSLLHLSTRYTVV